MIFNKYRILITGASSGIGRDLALKLAGEGADLILTARRKSLLVELEKAIRQKNGSEKANVFFIAGDITDPEVQKSCLDSAMEKFGGLDCLINNAGVGATALIEATDDDLARRLMDVNYFSALSLTRFAIPMLRKSAQEKKRSQPPMIVFLSSVVGFRGVPHYGAYGAAKFAVTGLSEAVRAELLCDGIEVLLVSPGTTKTEFFDSLLQSSSQPNMPKHRMVSSESVAGQIVSAMKKRKKRVIPYFQARILYYLNRAFPGLADRILARYK